jgi:hypothetical protein
LTPRRNRRTCSPVLPDPLTGPAGPAHWFRPARSPVLPDPLKPDPPDPPDPLTVHGPAGPGHRSRRTRSPDPPDPAEPLNGPAGRSVLL